MATVDSSQVEHTQDMMEFPEKQVFAYQHRASEFGSLDKVVVEQIRRNLVVDNQVEFVVVHNYQSLVDQDISKLDIVQTQVDPIGQVQIGVRIVGIEVVDIGAATIVESTVVVVVGTTVDDLVVVVAQQ